MSSGGWGQPPPGGGTYGAPSQGQQYPGSTPYPGASPYPPSGSAYPSAPPYPGASDPYPSAPSNPFPSPYPGAPATGASAPTYGYNAPGGFSSAPPPQPSYPQLNQAPPAMPHAHHAPPQSAPHHSHYQHPTPPHAHGGGAGRPPRRRAVLIGCNYNGTRHQLGGCVNDAKFLHFLLVSKFGFPESDMVLLQDGAQDPRLVPTRGNIMTAIGWLMQDVQPGDSLFFSFSGHGTQVRDRNGDETDGYDEALLPLDHDRAGVIVDDELHRLLVRPLPYGAKLHAVVDACHSGSAMDLPYIARKERGQVHWVREGRRGMPQHQGGLVVQFGACQDHQTAADTRRLARGVATGAATYCLVQAIEAGGVQQSYGQLLVAMSRALKQATGSGGADRIGGGLLGAVVGAALGGPMTLSQAQKCQLSSSHHLDLNMPLNI
ncbi:unnamed protein product [Pedinophyceae sp. YPF-701]|nr:unnamed protein product [Pedinophyceae sp. YPF-701]